MITIQEAYPIINFDGKTVTSYDPMLESIGIVLVRSANPKNIHNGWVILQDADQYGYLLFGWREDLCEIPIGCCKDYSELDTFRTLLKDNTKWGTKAELAEFFNTNDWTTDFSWQFKEFQAFVEAAKLALK